MSDTDAARLALLESNESFRQLSETHHAIDDHLKQLATKPHLSDHEQVEEVKLKKEKLRLKDQMEALVRMHAASATRSATA